MSQGNSTADQTANQPAPLQDPEQVMTLKIGPPEFPSFPQYSPSEQENAEKWGYEKELDEKEEKVLIPEAQ